MKNNVKKGTRETLIEKILINNSNAGGSRSKKYVSFLESLSIEELQILSESIVDEQPVLLDNIE